MLRLKNGPQVFTDVKSETDHYSSWPLTSINLALHFSLHRLYTWRQQPEKYDNNMETLLNKHKEEAN